MVDGAFLVKAGSLWKATTWQLPQHLPSANSSVPLLVVTIPVEMSQRTHIHTLLLLALKLKLLWKVALH